MQNKILYSPLALKDLDEIWDYIVFELKSPIAAENTINRIIDRIDSLQDFPETGARLIFDNGLDSGYRYVYYKHYIAFYHIQTNEVCVDLVMYEKRDYLKILFPNQ